VIQAAAIGGAQFCFVFLKAFQQRAVIHNTRWAILPTSMTMALFEAFVYANVAKVYIMSGTLAALGCAVAMGIGGGTGCLIAMSAHDKILGGANARR